MEDELLVAARSLQPGDTILIRGSWRRVVKIWLHPRSPYNKIHTVREDEDDRAIALYEKVALDFIFRKKSMQSTKNVHFSTAIEEMVTLQIAIEEYDKSNNLPERVQVVGSSFEVESVLIQRKCHEDMMASFNRLKNAVNAVKKP